MPKVKKRAGVIGDTKIALDVAMLNTMIRYGLCEYVSDFQLKNLQRLVNALDFEQYNYNQDLLIRLKVLKRLCEAEVDHNIRNFEMVQTYLNDDPEVSDYMKTALIDKNALSVSECNYVGQNIAERIQLLCVYREREGIRFLMDQLDKTGFTSYEDVLGQLKQKLSELLVNLQGANANAGVLRQFNFTDEQFYDLLEIIVNKSKKPASVLLSSVRQLNAILSPGFRGGRLYTILGGSGKFKSGTLLNIADGIRISNPQIIPYENGMRKTVLFITCENTIEETIERLFDMYSDEEQEIQNMTMDEIIQVLREKGKFQFNDSEGIDMEFRYYANLEISTADIYSLIQELRENNKQVIACVVDYIKRLKSIHTDGGDERLRLSFVAKELKSMAQFFEIPVITAMQINRNANALIDAAMRENRQDPLQHIDASAIGNCWDIIEESDWVCLINMTKTKSTGQVFLTFKRLKIRGKKDNLAVESFNHPFTNGKNIRLYPDIFDDKPASVISIESDLISLEDVEENLHRKKTVAQQKMDDKKSSILSNLGAIGGIRAISLDGAMREAV